MLPYAAAWDCNQARMSPTRQAVIFSDSLMGAGNCPKRTQRHKVDGLTGMTGAGLLGFLTSCDSRSRALSGSWSNGVMVAATGNGLALVMALRCGFALGDIACLPLVGMA